MNRTSLRKEMLYQLLSIQMEKVQQDFVDWFAQFLRILRLDGRKVIYYFPFAFISLLISLKVVSKPLYWSVMAMEDSLAESLTSVFYLISSVISIGLTIRSYRKQFFDATTKTAAILAIVFFVIAMEEISWGQRILQIQSPEFFAQNNQQGELNLHNFLSRYLLHIPYILVGLYGGLSWKIFPKSFQERFPKICQFLTPDRMLCWYFLPTAILYIYHDYISVFLAELLGLTIFKLRFGDQGWIIARDEEPIELLLSIGILCFMAILYNRQTHQKLL